MKLSAHSLGDDINSVIVTTRVLKEKPFSDEEDDDILGQTVRNVFEVCQMSNIIPASSASRG